MRETSIAVQCSLHLVSGRSMPRVSSSNPATGRGSTMRTPRSHLLRPGHHMEDLCTNACGGASQREWRAMVIAASLVGTAVVARALRALDPAQSDPLIEAV